MACRAARQRVRLSFVLTRPCQDSTHCPTGQVCNELWDSTTLPNSTSVMPGAVKFTVPTIVDGYIFVAGGAPGYFGMTSTACPPPPPTSPCGGQLTILH